MNALLSRFSDIVINSRGPDATIDSPAQPAILPDTLPPIIKKRWSQALRVNNRADWQQMAQLCGAFALGFFQDSAYDPQNADFKACCKLARLAQLRSVECLTQGLALPRTARRGMGVT